MFNEIQNGLILAKGQIREGNDNVNLAISIQNKTKKTIKQNLLVETGDNWSSIVSSIPIEILPGETYYDTIKLTRLTSIYPLPRIKFIYPFGHNLEYKYDEPIILERVLVSSKVSPINAPTIDGLINSAEWNRSIKTTDFGEMDGTLSPVERTELSFMHDNQFLYIAINCHDSRMNELRSNAVDRDGNVHLDDAVGMIITPNPKETYQFYNNSIGTIWDQKFNRADSTYHPEWNGSFLIANSKDNFSWSTEIRIPLRELNYDPATKQLKINFRRKQPRLRASAFLTPMWNYEADLHPVLLLD